MGDEHVATTKSDGLPLRRPFAPAEAPWQLEARRGQERARVRFLLMMAGGFLLANLHPGGSREALTLFWGLALLMQLVAVSLLAHGILKPGQGWGASVPGQVCALVGSGLLFAAITDVVEMPHAWMEVAVVLIGLVLWLKGVYMERDALRRPRCV